MTTKTEDCMKALEWFEKLNDAQTHAEVGRLFDEGETEKRLVHRILWMAACPF
jgi:hypothetical protein